MGNKVLGYVKFKESGNVFPYIDKDENGFLVETKTVIGWVNKNSLDEVNGSEEKENPFIKNVHDLIDRQQEKGLKKYGTLVNKDDYSLLGWIEHAQQEAADLLIYLEVIKSKVKDVIG